VGKW